MGRVLCKKHGNQFTTFVCWHVSDAIVDKHYCAGIQQRVYSIDGFPELDFSGWYCPHCIEDYRMPPSARVTEEEGGRLLCDPDLQRPMCAECFAEWKAWQP